MSFWWLGYFIIWRLGYKITQTGTSPLAPRTCAIFTLQPPTTLKKTRSSLCFVHYISIYIPNLAQLCHLLRSLLGKSIKYT